MPATGKKLCQIYKKIVSTPHHCYVQVKPTPKKNKEELNMYIYYDFECFQENGIHTSNHCVDERVCQHCDSLDIDTPCDHCQATKRCFVFEGPHTLKDFMDWLLETEADDRGALAFKNQDVIVIAHNFKGYDGQFICNYLVHTDCIKPKLILNGRKILCMEACGL
jgi:hypothetical protein